MIKLKTLLNESDEAWRSDWLERHNARVDSTGKLIAYHGTPTKNIKSIKQNGFGSHSYFSLNPDYSMRIATTYHNTTEDNVTVLELHLPMDAIDFVASDIFSTRVIKFEETQ